VIPADLRRALGLAEGDVLLARVEGGDRLVLENRRAAVRRLRGSWRKVAGSRDLVGELLEERGAEAELEDAELAGDEGDITKAREKLSRIGERQLAARPRHKPVR